MAHIRATQICYAVILTQLYGRALPPMKTKKTNPEFNRRWTQMNADGMKSNDNGAVFARIFCYYQKTTNWLSLERLWSTFVPPREIGQYLISRFVSFGKFARSLSSTSVKLVHLTSWRDSRSCKLVSDAYSFVGGWE